MPLISLEVLAINLAQLAGLGSLEDLVLEQRPLPGVELGVVLHVLGELGRVDEELAVVALDYHVRF